MSYTAIFCLTAAESVIYAINTYKQFTESGFVIYAVGILYKEKN